MVDLQLQPTWTLQQLIAAMLPLHGLDPSLEYALYHTNREAWIGGEGGNPSQPVQQVHSFAIGVSRIRCFLFLIIVIVIIINNWNESSRLFLLIIESLIPSSAPFPL